MHSDEIHVGLLGVAHATRDLRAGETLGHENSRDFRVTMQPARPVQPGEPLPILLAHGAALATDVPRGALLTTDMVIPREDTALWSLRIEQDLKL